VTKLPMSPREARKSNLRLYGECRFCHTRWRLDKHLAVYHHGPATPGRRYCPGTGRPPMAGTISDRERQS